MLLSLKAQNDESGDSRLEAYVVICGNFIVDGIVASVHGVVLLIRTAYESCGEDVVVRIRAASCAPVTYSHTTGGGQELQKYLSHETLP